MLGASLDPAGEPSEHGESQLRDKARGTAAGFPGGWVGPALRNISKQEVGGSGRLALGLLVTKQLTGWVEWLLFYLGEQTWGCSDGEFLFLTLAAPRGAF